MKRLKIMMVFFLMFIITLTGCSKENTKVKNEDGKETNKTAADNSKKPIDDKEKITIQFGLVASESHSSYKAAAKFKEAVEERTNGQITVELYPNSVLGGDSQLTQAVSLGTVQMAHPATTVLTQYDEKWGIFDMPFMFSSPEEAFKAIDGPVGQELGKSLESVNIINLGFGFNGVRNMTNNVRPIHSPDDLDGIKMRVMESPVFIDMFTYLGANATPMSFSELFTGLQQKTVDGEENPASLIFESKFNEVQKYFSETQHVYNFLAYVMNKDFFEGLSEENQKIISEAAQEYLINWQRETEVSENQDYIKKLEESGMKVNRVSEDDLNKFKEKIEPMYDKYKEQFGEEIFNKILETNG